MPQVIYNQLIANILIPIQFDRKRTSSLLLHVRSSFSDHAYLVEALQIADRFLKRLNENVRLKENEERLEWIQTNVQQGDLGIMFNSNTNKLGPRKLLHHGILTKVNC